MKTRTRKLLRTGLSLLMSLCLTLSVIVIGTPSASAGIIGEAIVDKAVDQLIEDGMRVCCMGLDWLGEATGNEDVQKAFSFIEEWVFESSVEIAIDELKELCEQILNELKEIETEMEASFALITSILTRNEIKAARSRVDNKWTITVDNVIKSYQATNALNTYKAYLSDAVGNASSETLLNDKNKLLSAYSGMYPEDIPVEMNTPEHLKEIMFESGTINSKFVNLISDLAAGLNYDSLTTGSVALYASQFAYMAFPFSHQQYQYLHAVMEKQILYVMLVEMMYNEYLYQQGEYLKDKYGEDSDKYRGYLEYQTSFHELMTSGDSCVNALIGKMLDRKMEVDGMGRINLSLSDYMKPEDACSVELENKNFVTSVDYKQEVKDNGVLTYKIRDNSNISKNQYTSKYMKYKRVMTHTTSGNKVYYILDPDQFKSSSALRIGNIDHKVDIKNDSDIHAESCDYINFKQEVTDGINKFQLITDLEMKSFAPLFNTAYFQLSGSTVDGYLGSTESYLPKYVSDSSSSGFTKLFFLTDRSQRTHWAPAITAYTTFKALDGSKIFSTGKVYIKEGMEKDDDDVIYTGSKDFKNNVDKYGFSIILAGKSDTFSQELSASISNGRAAEIKITASDGKSIHANETMKTECGKSLDIAIDTKGELPNALYMKSANNAKVIIASGSDITNLTPDSNGVYHIKYSMPYSKTEFILEMTHDNTYIKTGDVQNCTVSFSKNTLVDSAVYRPLDTAYVYISCPEGYIPSELNYTDKYGDHLGYPFYVSEETTGSVTLYTYSFTVPYKENVIVNCIADKGITVSADTSKFIYDSNNSPKAYIQFEDYNTHTFHDESLVVPSYYNTIYGRYIFDDDYFPVHMKVVGRYSGTVFYDNDVSNIQSGDKFMLINRVPSYAASFNEDVIVIPSFEQNAPKVTLDDFSNCTAYFDENSDVTEKRSRPGETVTFYLKAPESCNRIDVKGMDNDGNLCEISQTGQPVQSGTDLIYTYEFTMPDSDVIICGEAYEGTQKYTATIGEFTGGTASFDILSDVSVAKVPVNDNCVFYVRAPKTSILSAITVKDSSDNIIPTYKAADTGYDGDDAIYAFGFIMPNSDVTITGALQECLIAKTDKNGFVKNEEGGTVAYILLKEPDAFAYSSDYVKLKADTNELSGKFAYSVDYYPTNLRIVGEQTGKVYMDSKCSKTAEEFTFRNPGGEPFTENLIVTPTFVKVGAEPEKKDVGIRTYEELVEFAENVKNNYAEYGSASVWLENYIVAPEGSTWTTPIGSADQPFNGTFDGRGLAIAGLNINDANVGGLFGVIGENGCVKDLAAAKVTFNVKAKAAGGIAAYNYGLIDHCISGVNSDFKKLGITIKKFNSTIYGNVSGGIAAYNYGTIKGTRSCAYVIGADAAGIACINNGTIYGCANNGALGRTSVESIRVGGFAVENYGSITGCYNSSKENGGTKTILSAVCVANEGTITNCCYTTFGNLIKAVNSTKDEESVKIVEKTIEYMLTEEFADEMNNVTDDTVSWKHMEYKDKLINQGFPVVKGRFIEAVSLVNNNNLKVSAFMHKSMNVSYNAMNTQEEVYATFEAASGTRTMTCAYNVSAKDASGNEIPAELWCEGVTVSVPVSSEDVRIIMLDDEGETITFAPESIENGWATFTLSEPAAFAVAENTPSNSVPTPGKPDNGNVRTGDSTLPIAVSCTFIVISVLAVLATRRRKERE